jgi:phage shock protein C
MQKLSYFAQKKLQTFMFIEKIKTYFEKHAFGVCTHIGDKVDISISNIRLYFIYASFLTLGSPVIIYLFLAFWMNIKKYLRGAKNPSVWEF